MNLGGQDPPPGGLQETNTGVASELPPTSVINGGESSKVMRL